MKNKLLLYGLLFSLVVNIFQFVNSGNVIDVYERDIKYYKNKSATTEKEIEKLKKEDLFSLTNNDDAREYFIENFDNINPDDVASFVKDALIDYNNNKKGNPLVAYEQIGENPFIIDNVKFLNHRFLIANFSDGKICGDVLIKYFYNGKDKKPDFESIETVIFTNTLK
jgi:lipopolysaccharide export LptBFGC system permease protein LptF